MNTGMRSIGSFETILCGMACGFGFRGLNTETSEEATQ